MVDKNGKPITWKWIVGVLLTLLLIVGSFAAASVKERADTAHLRIDVMQEKKVDKDRYECDMNRIEKKLDTLIERTSK
jgi:uncharacterized protein YpmS